MKTEKVVLIIVGVGVASVGGYMAWKKFANPSPATVPSSTPVTSELPANKADLVKLLDQNPLSKNDSSPIQKFIESKGKVLPIIAEPVPVAKPAPAATPTTKTIATTKPVASVYYPSTVAYRDDFSSDRFSNQQAISGFNLF